MSAEIVVGTCYRCPATGEVVLVRSDARHGWLCTLRAQGRDSHHDLGDIVIRNLDGWECVGDPEPAPAAPPASTAIVVQRSRLRAFGHRVARLAEVRGLEIDDASSPHMLVVRVTFYVREDDSPLVAVVRGENLDEAFARAEKLLREAVEVAS